MTMDGSSNSGWGKPTSSRGVDASFSEPHLRLLNASRLSLSTDASQSSMFGLGRRLRDTSGQGPADHLRNRLGIFDVSEEHVAVDPLIPTIEWGDISLRQWLDNPERVVDVAENLHIFRQIVQIVNSAHCEGVVLNNIRPSCFVMSSFNRVSFIESASCSDSGSDSMEDGMNNQNMETNKQDATEWRSGLCPKESRPFSETSSRALSLQATDLVTLQGGGGCEPKDGRCSEKAEEKPSFPMKELLLIETSWYTSPEEIAGAPCSCASDIYRLGVLLFELFSTYGSIEEKSRTMSSLRHRVLPPQLLLKWPKEASFCLWLLHPDPCSRPKMSELLQSEFLNEQWAGMDDREAAIELREKIEEQELLLEFLLLTRQAKQEASSKLRDTISFLSSDIEEIQNKQRILREKAGYPPLLSATHQQINEHENVRMMIDLNQDESEKSDTVVEDEENSLSKNTRLIKNFKKLESAYLAIRQRSVRMSVNRGAGYSQQSGNSRGSVVLTERSTNTSQQIDHHRNDGESSWINPFLDGLCKYLSCTKLTEKADLKQADLLNSSNLVCAVSFDRDGDFFATAGVNKKIKVFECDPILNGNRAIHYPVVELPSRAKLSSICWNSYIKSQIASSNFEGTVQVWDISRSQLFMELREHERRVWSIDFSAADPTMLASGSDDGSVKLWSINQGTSIGTIRTKANVCCVQFPSNSGRHLAFGSADHRIYYYDLRSPRTPLCTLIGHNKTVSYVKFIDSTNLVSSSTDNTLKLWDLSACASHDIEGPLQSFTGHTNVKNFVGLSVYDGYIATGSETNEVYIYHKAFPMPALSFKFSKVDQLSGLEVDDSSQFISSVCWRGQSSIMVAANSAGDVKLLEMT